MNTHIEYRFWRLWVEYDAQSDVYFGDGTNLKTGEVLANVAAGDEDAVLRNLKQQADSREEVTG